MTPDTLNISTSSGGSALVPPAMGMPPSSTLPTIPNPNPPAPKKLAVVTPAAAKSDLAQKQATTAQVSAATAAQTQAAVAKLSAGQQAQYNQLVQAGAPTDKALTAAQQVPAQQPQQQNQQQTTTPGGQQPANGVTLPNGTPAQVDQTAGTVTTSDGTKLSWNGSAWIDPSTGLPPGQQNGQAGATDSSDPTSNLILNQLNQSQQQFDQAYQQHQQQMNQLLNGTFPLTSDQQQQVVSLGAQFDQLKALQQQANNNYVNAVTITGIRNGHQQYMPQLAAFEVSDAMSKGIARIASLDIQASQAVATLKQGFMDNDYKIINQSYKDLQDAVSTKTNTLNAIQNTIKNQVDLETSRLNQQQLNLSIQGTLVNNVAQATLANALNADGTLDINAIMRQAENNGIDPQALYGAVEKARQQEETFGQTEQKFHSDQLQAAANLSKTYADTAKTRLDIANATPADLSKLPPEQQGLVSAFNSALTGLPANAQGQAKQTFNQILNSGDTQAAKDYIVRVAVGTLPAAQQTSVLARSEGINSLKEIQSLLDQAKANQNATNQVSGNIAQIAANLGGSADPDLQYIGQRIQTQLQQYRHAMTGAAFTEAEAKQYAKIFPDITNTNALNTTKISSLTDALDSNNRSDLEFLVGKTNYDKIFDTPAPQLPSATSGTTAVNPDVLNKAKDQKFDVQGALSSGYTLDEITKYLNGK